jgi:hypothetical protein
MSRTGVLISCRPSALPAQSFVPTSSERDEARGRRPGSFRPVGCMRGLGGASIESLAAHSAYDGTAHEPRDGAHDEQVHPPLNRPGPSPKRLNLTGGEPALGTAFIYRAPMIVASVLGAERRQKRQACKTRDETQLPGEPFHTRLRSSCVRLTTGASAAGDHAPRSHKPTFCFVLKGRSARTECGTCPARRRHARVRQRRVPVRPHASHSSGLMRHSRAVI